MKIFLRTVLSAIVLVSFIFSSTQFGITAAEAAVAVTAKDDPIEIKKIKNQKVKKGKQITIRPKVKTLGSDIRVVSKTLTVTQGRLTVKNKKSIKLGPGKYTVKQKVKYQTKKVKTKTFKGTDFIIADCNVTKVHKNKSIKSKISVSCKLPGVKQKKKLTVNLEWEYCPIDSYWDGYCSFDEYWDDLSWWEGKTTDGKLNFESASYDDLTPKKGEAFTAYITLADYYDTWKVKSTSWSKSKTKTYSQKLKISKKK